MEETPPESPAGTAKTVEAEEPTDSDRPRRKWLWRGVLVAVIVAALGGALASILLQDDDSSSEGEELTAKLPPPVRKLVNGMKPADKAQALLVAGFDDPNRLGKARPGGYLVTAASWPGAGKGEELTAKLHKSGGRVQPLVAVRQEGGDYRALSDLPPSENELDIGIKESAKDAEAWGLKTGEALRAEGFDLNLAPVADVATLDSPIADRAFSDDPPLVTDLTAAAVRGCRKSRIACAVSHFPGQGAASEDTSETPATVGQDVEGLEARDLPPFDAAFRQRVPAVVLSLAFYAAYDPVTPAALSPAVSEDLLRDELGFKGVAITDDLSSGAVVAAQGAPEAAVAAVAAGADLVVVSAPGEARKTAKALEQAVRDGSVPSDRLDEAVARVLLLKRKLGLL